MGEHRAHERKREGVCMRERGEGEVKGVRKARRDRGVGREKGKEERETRMVCFKLRTASTGERPDRLVIFSTSIMDATL